MECVKRRAWWSAKCNARSVECKVWSVHWVKCGVWSVECSVWSGV